MELVDWGEFTDYDFEIWTSEREPGSKLLILPNLPGGELLNTPMEIVRKIQGVSRLRYPLTVLVEKDHRHYVSLLNEDGEFLEGFLSREVEDVEARLEEA